MLIFSNLIGDWMLTANTEIGSFLYMQIKIPIISHWIVDRILIFPFFLILALIVVL